MTGNISLGTQNTGGSLWKSNSPKHMDGAASAFRLDGQPRPKVPNAYFALAKDGMVEANGVTYICDYETGALKLGDCSKPWECIRVSLSGGGSLLFNPDSIDGLTQSIGMFSAEDQKRILEAIERYNMAKAKLDELEEEENADPKAVAEDAASTDEAVQGDDEAAANAKKETSVEGDRAAVTKSYRAVLKERTDTYEIYDVIDRMAG